MTTRRLWPWTVLALPPMLLIVGAQNAPPQDPQEECQRYELAVRINPNGDVPNPGDADGQVGCPFILKVENLSPNTTRQVSMKLARNRPGGQTQEFDLCVGRQLHEPHAAPPGLSQVACSVKPNLFAGLGNTTHPRDRDDDQGPVERGFKYTLSIGDEPAVDPDLKIRR